MTKNKLSKCDMVVDTGGEPYLEIEYKYQVSVPFVEFRKKIARYPSSMGKSIDYFYTRPGSERGEFYRLREFDPYTMELTYKKKFTNWNITRKEINIPLDGPFREVHAFIQTFATYRGDLEKEYCIWLNWFGVTLSFYKVEEGTHSSAAAGKTFVEIEADNEKQLRKAEKELTKLFGLTAKDRVKESLFELHFEDGLEDAQ